MQISLPNIIKIMLTAVAFSLVMTTMVNAQEEDSASDSTVAIEAQAALPADTAANREEAKNAIEEARADALEARADARADAEAFRAEVRASSTADREAAQAVFEEKKETRRAAIGERAKERITNLAANISNRMDAAVARIQNVIDRLDSRIVKLEEAGLDVTEAKRIMASAQTSLNAAAADIATIDVDVNAAVTAEDPRAAWQTVKAKYQSIRDQLRTAHSEIKAAVQALKDSAQATRSEQNASTSNDTAVEADVEEGEMTVTSEGETTL